LLKVSDPVPTTRVTSPRRPRCAIECTWRGWRIEPELEQCDQCVLRGPSEAAPAESVASAALRTGLRAWRLHQSQCCGRRGALRVRQRRGVCYVAGDGIHMWQFERSRPEGRARRRATRRWWHRRRTHWVEHGVRHVCMSCARRQLWRDDGGSLRQTTAARLSGRRLPLKMQLTPREDVPGGGDIATPWNVLSWCQLHL
jgi:hypothetical protein